jgi:uncharacterized protein YqhQ
MNLQSGRSCTNWISFTSNNTTSIAIREADGTITAGYEDLFTEKMKKTNRLIPWIGSYYLPILIVKSFLILPLINNNTLTKLWYILPILIYMIVFALNEIYSLNKKRNGGDFRKNHGAEHKVYRAYRTLGRIPTVEEAMSFSRFAKNCGTTVMVGIFAAQLFGFIMFLCFNFQISELLLYIIPKLFFRCPPFSYMGMAAQYITTSNPGPENIELAIAALKALKEEDTNPYVLFKKEDNFLTQAKKTIERSR